MYSSEEEEDERVAYSSDDSELDGDDDGADVEDDIDMTLIQREFNGDESFDEEEDATLQKRANELENELTMATKRCVALKATLEATKQATKDARRQGMLSPAKPRAVVRKNMFAGGDYDENEADDVFGVDEDEEDEEDEGDDEYLEDSLEESYDDDDTFDTRKAEAKDEYNRHGGGGGGGGGRDEEAKSLYHRRAESKQDSEGGGPMHIVTPRVQIDNANDEEEGRYSELTDVVSPSARIEDRVQGLRSRCEEGLGADTFAKAYDFLKSLQERVADEADAAVMTPGGTVLRDGDKDDDEKVLEQLTAILGDDKLHYWALVDQLLFCEELRR